MKREFYLVFAIILIICGSSLANRILFSDPGTIVEVSVIDQQSNKTLLKTFDLSENTTYPIITDSDNDDAVEGTNLLVIQDNRVWISEANCPNQDCVKQGKISMNGEMLVCLPHRLTVSIIEK